MASHGSNFIVERNVVLRIGIGIVGIQLFGGMSIGQYNWNENGSCIV